MPDDPRPRAENKRWWLMGILLGLALLAIVFAPFVMMFSALEPSCGNDHLREFASPDGKLKAVIFRRDCGATTAFSTQVSILSAAKPLPNEAGNLFIVAGDSTDLAAHWTDDTHLLISNTWPGQIREQLPVFGPIQVSYREGP